MFPAGVCVASAADVLSRWRFLHLFVLSVSFHAGLHWTSLPPCKAVLAGRQLPLDLRRVCMLLASGHTGPFAVVANC